MDHNAHLEATVRHHRYEISRLAPKREFRQCYRLALVRNACERALGVAA